MAVDTTAKAAARWSELSKAESTTIDKVLKGTATKADTDRLLKLINQYSKLAGDVFKRGVGIIETAADKRIAAEVKKRSKGGNELTDGETEQLVKDVTAAVYQERSSDLLQAIEELVDSANESLSTFSEQQYDDAVDTAKSQYDELIKRLQGQVKDKGGAVVTPSGVKTVEDVLREVEESQQGGGSDSDLIGDEDHSSPYSTQNKAEQAARRQEDKEATDNWAGAWWRKFNEYKDSFGGKAKDAGKNLLGELAKLGGLAYIFSPVFRKWIDDKLSEIGNFFTMDNVKKLLGEAWEFIKKEADEFTNHLKEMMGFKDADLNQQVADQKKAEADNRAAAETLSADAAKLRAEAEALKSTDEGKAWFPNATQQAAQEKSLEAAQKESAARRKERTADKIERARKQKEIDMATLGGGGGGGGGGSSSSATPPPSTTEVAATPGATSTATSVPGANIETAAAPPAPADTNAAGAGGADGKAVVPPAGGGSQEGYVPSTGNPLLSLSNMFK